MRALIVDKNNKLYFDPEFAPPRARQDTAVLNIISAGICNTDLEIVSGYMGFSGVLGHEFVAVVDQGPENLIGKRVVGEINVACGNCDYCRKGISSQCPNRSTVGIDRHDGAFADQLCLNINNIHIVPENVSNDSAVFTEPLAAALQILELSHISPNDAVVVIGAGKLGLLCAQVLKLTGAQVRVIVRHDKQAHLLERWGIEAVPEGQLPDKTQSVVVDCTGTESGFSAALNLLKPRGTLVLKSTYKGLTNANLTQVVIDEIQIMGNRCGPFDAALRLLSNNLIDVESMIEARYPLDQGLQAMQHAAQKGVLKVLLDIQ